MNEQWQELKETIIEMRDNDGTGTQQEVCRFLANLMDVLERDASLINEDAISRQAVLDICDKYNGQGYVWTVIRGEVEQLPSVTPQPKTGHWIYSKAVNTSEIIWSECSECKDGERGCAKRMKYCPNCGTKMVEPQEGSR